MSPVTAPDRVKLRTLLVACTGKGVQPTVEAERRCVCEQERRQIERALFEGKLWAVAATNALELGVDVGSLDATLHLGFPGAPSASPSADCMAH